MPNPKQTKEDQILDNLTGYIISMISSLRCLKRIDMLKARKARNNLIYALLKSIDED